MFIKLDGAMLYSPSRMKKSTRSSPQWMFLLKGLLKICSTFTGEYPCQIVLHDLQSCFKPLSIPLFTQLFCSNIYASSKSEKADLMKTAQLFDFYFIPNCLKAFKVINWKLWEQVLWITLICVMLRNLWR